MTKSRTAVSINTKNSFAHHMAKMKEAMTKAIGKDVRDRVLHEAWMHDDNGFAFRTQAEDAVKVDRFDECNLHFGFKRSVSVLHINHNWTGEVEDVMLSVTVRYGSAKTVFSIGKYEEPADITCQIMQWLSEFDTPIWQAPAA